MKTALHVLAVLVCLVWAGAYYLRELGRAFEQLDSVLVIDDASQSIVRVDHERESLVAICVGRIEGTTLRLVDDTSVRDSADESGRTVYERFTVLPGEAAGRTDCAYERYTF